MNETSFDNKSIKSINSISSGSSISDEEDVPVFESNPPLIFNNIEIRNKKKNNIFPIFNQSTPVLHAPTQILFLKNDFNYSDQKQLFITDAIVNQPIRIGSGYGSYICYHCTLFNEKGNPIILRKRYSDFVELRNLLIKSDSTLKKSIPKLPPKKLVGKFTPKFVEQRRKELDYFFKYIVLHPTLGSHSIVKQWITPYLIENMKQSSINLDASLDDIIKQKKNKPNTNKNKSRPPIQKNNAKIIKQTNINSRLSIKPVKGPVFTSKVQKKTDPSQIIITKKLNTIKTTPQVKSIIQTKTPQIKSQINITPQKSRLELNTPIRTLLRPSPPVTSFIRKKVDTLNDNQTFSIRGRSKQEKVSQSISIKGESGPTTVIVTGLDLGANSEDVKISFEQFGNILYCQVLRDRSGLSFGQAEIEFSTRAAALNCIARMDNQLADGKLLHIILKEKRPSQTLAQKQIRSIISPPSGKLYSDHMTSRYDIQRN